MASDPSSSKLKKQEIGHSFEKSFEDEVRKARGTGKEKDKHKKKKDEGLDEQLVKKKDHSKSEEEEKRSEEKEKSRSRERSGEKGHHSEKKKTREMKKSGEDDRGGQPVKKGKNEQDSVEPNIEPGRKNPDDKKKNEHSQEREKDAESKPKNKNDNKEHPKETRPLPPDDRPQTRPLFPDYPAPNFLPPPPPPGAPLDQIDPYYARMLQDDLAYQQQRMFHPSHHLRNEPPVMGRKQEDKDAEKESKDGDPHHQEKSGELKSRSGHDRGRDETPAKVLVKADRGGKHLTRTDYRQAPPPPPPPPQAQPPPPPPPPEGGQDYNEGEDMERGEVNDNFGAGDSVPPPPGERGEQQGNNRAVNRQDFREGVPIEVDHDTDAPKMGDEGHNNYQKGNDGKNDADMGRRGVIVPTTSGVGTYGSALTRPYGYGGVTGYGGLRRPYGLGSSSYGLRRPYGGYYGRGLGSYGYRRGRYPYGSRYPYGRGRYPYGRGRYPYRPVVGNTVHQVAYPAGGITRPIGGLLHSSETISSLEDHSKVLDTHETISTENLDSIGHSLEHPVSSVVRPSLGTASLHHGGIRGYGGLGYGSLGYGGLGYGYPYRRRGLLGSTGRWPYGSRRYSSYPYGGIRRGYGYGNSLYGTGIGSREHGSYPLGGISGGGSSSGGISSATESTVYATVKSISSEESGYRRRPYGLGYHGSRYPGAGYLGSGVRRPLIGSRHPLRPSSLLHHSSEDLSKIVSKEEKAHNPSKEIIKDIVSKEIDKAHIWNAGVRPGLGSGNLHHTTSVLGNGLHHSGIGTGIGTGIHSGLGTGIDTGLGAALGTGIHSGLGTGIHTGLGGPVRMMRYPRGGLCPIDFDLSSGDKCLSLRRDPMTYMDAMIACTNLGARLAEPHSQTEADAMRHLGRDINFWIGVTDLETEGRFVYVSDGNPVFDNFHPFWIDRDHGVGHCVAHSTGIPSWLYKDYPVSTSWADSNCQLRLGYMCEMPRRAHPTSLSDPDLFSDEDEEYYLCNAYRETDSQHLDRVKKLTALLAKKK